DKVQPLLRFDIEFQAVGLSLLGRNLGLNLGTGLIGGLSILGLWSIADRFLSIPALLLESAWRVTFPMMSRLIAVGEEPQKLLERHLGLVAFGMGVPATALASAAPALIPALLGSKWASSADPLPFACV